ncbi:alpha/beta-hydrolase [Massarina eburnea CBS 473.64]|uniref:Acyl-protein thioesterase 1 n=1 Tax=Massarina eburnea CBS 473.64 TaxID=1395130 RepID=A0A6A6RFV0_9PLEO|nr:alpha/beta-hydrolase [Massarina eburnea CBS 473.64]
MSPAWYLPTSFPPPGRPELADPEDEPGILASISSLTSLIDSQIALGIPASRIVLGGFSQGHAIGLLTGLLSPSYAGKLAGLVGLSGYMPLADRLETLRSEAGLDTIVRDDVEFFVARGTRDMLIPKRIFTGCVDVLKGLGVGEGRLTVKEYEGMGHVMRGDELRDLGAWLERVVPRIE